MKYQVVDSLHTLDREVRIDELVHEPSRPIQPVGQRTLAQSEFARRLVSLIKPIRSHNPLKVDN